MAGSRSAGSRTALYAPGMSDTIALIRRHRSIRRFTDAAVPDEEVRRAVEAGQAASTSSGIQAYCVIRVRDDGHRRVLAELTGPQEKVRHCGAFFVVCGDTRRHRLVCARAGARYDAQLEAFLLAVVDAALFSQNLILAFESMGYGICCIGGLRNRLFDVDRLLDLPEGVYPLYGLCVGVAAEEPGPRPRLPVETVLFEGAYPDDEEILRAVDAYDDRYRAYLTERGAAPDAARGWSEAMADRFSQPRREDIGPYYRSKGADLA